MAAGTPPAVNDPYRFQLPVLIQERTVRWFVGMQAYRGDCDIGEDQVDYFDWGPGAPLTIVRRVGGEDPGWRRGDGGINTKQPELFRRLGSGTKAIDHMKKGYSPLNRNATTI